MKNELIFRKSDLFRAKIYNSILFSSLVFWLEYEACFRAYGLILVAIVTLIVYFSGYIKEYKTIPKEYLIIDSNGIQYYSKFYSWNKIKEINIALDGMQLCMIKDTESIKEIEVSFYAFTYKMAIFYNMIKPHSNGKVGVNIGLLSKYIIYPISIFLNKLFSRNPINREWKWSKIFNEKRKNGNIISSIWKESRIFDKIGCVGFLVFCIVFVLSISITNIKRNTNSVEAEGYIVEINYNLRKEYHRGGAPNLQVYYYFMANGNRVDASAIATYRDIKELKVGNRVTVKYEKDNPKNCVIIDYHPTL